MRPLGRRCACAAMVAAAAVVAISKLAVFVGGAADSASRSERLATGAALPKPVTATRSAPHAAAAVETAPFDDAREGAAYVTVRSEHGGAISGAIIYRVAPTVRCVSRADADVIASTDANGGARIPVRRGDERPVVVFFEGLRPAALAAPGAGDDVEVVLGGGIAMEITARFTDGSPVEGAVLRLSRASFALATDLARDDGMPGADERFAERRATTDASGRATCAGLTPGLWHYALDVVDGAVIGDRTLRIERLQDAVERRDFVVEPLFAAAVNLDIHGAHFRAWGRRGQAPVPRSFIVRNLEAAALRELRLMRRFGATMNIVVRRSDAEVADDLAEGRAPVVAIDLHAADRPVKRVDIPLVPIGELTHPSRIHVEYGPEDGPPVPVGRLLPVVRDPDGVELRGVPLLIASMCDAPSRPPCPPYDEARSGSPLVLPVGEYGIRFGRGSSLASVLSETEAAVSEGTTTECVLVATRPIVRCRALLRTPFEESADGALSLFEGSPRRLTAWLQLADEDVWLPEGDFEAECSLDAYRLAVPHVTVRRPRDGETAALDLRLRFRD